MKIIIVSIMLTIYCSSCCNAQGKSNHSTDRINLLELKKIDYTLKNQDKWVLKRKNREEFLIKTIPTQKRMEFASDYDEWLSKEKISSLKEVPYWELDDPGFNSKNFLVFIPCSKRLHWAKSWWKRQKFSLKDETIRKILLDSSELVFRSRMSHAQVEDAYFKSFDDDSLFPKEERQLKFVIEHYFDQFVVLKRLEDFPLSVDKTTLNNAI